MMRHRRLLAIAVAMIATFGLIAQPVMASGVNFSLFTSPTSLGEARQGKFRLHADVNNDGREDFIYLDHNLQSFDIQLANGRGWYAMPVNYPIADAGYYIASLAVADFNGDGNADVVISAYSGVSSTDDARLYLFLNNGNGIFSKKTYYSLDPSQSTGLVVAGDFNHDGKMDIAYEGPGDNPGVTVWLGDGRGGLTAGPSTRPEIFGSLAVGDFDGDGYADLAIFGGQYGLHAEVLYGDGTGYFPTQTGFQLPGGALFNATDVNSDGKMDIVYSYYPYSYGGKNGIPTRYVGVYYGDANRTWTNNTVIPISHCVSTFAPPIAADMNGDGIKDLVVPEVDCNAYNTGYEYIGILTRNSNATYNQDQIVYTSPVPNLGVNEGPGPNVIGPYILRADVGYKPDIAFTVCTSSEDCSGTDHYLEVLMNNTEGNFPSCAPPLAYEGINVCSSSPDGTATSPVAFNMGAAGQVQMRKMEVWVDGKKLGEQLNGFSNYTFFDKSYDLFSGSHKVDVYAAGWDNSLVKKSYSLTVK